MSPVLATDCLSSTFGDVTSLVQPRTAGMCQLFARDCETAVASTMLMCVQHFATMKMRRQGPHDLI